MLQKSLSMKQLKYTEIIKMAKTAIEEYSNWDETEIPVSAREQEIKKIKKETVIQKVAEQTKTAEQNLEEFKQQICNCNKCPLGKTKLNFVFGVGSPYSDIMFIGEGPGFQEDHKGEPFIGRAGMLLDKIIEAMGYKRSSVYIANIVKCHPMKDPSNPELKNNDRPPTQQEMQTCKPYLDKQIEIISPRVIVTLGASSTRALLNTEDVISSLRGKFAEYNGIKLMPTYHPAALLRNPNLKKDVWHDMKLVMAFLKNK